MPEHCQINAMCEKIMGNLTMITHAAVTKRKNPAHFLQPFLREYRTMSVAKTRKTPLELLMGRSPKTTVPHLRAMDLLDTKKDREIHER